MKIQNDATRALLAQDEAHRKPQTGVAGAGGFDALLSGQIQRTDAAGAAAASPLGQALTAEQTAEQSAAALALLVQSSGNMARTGSTADEELEALAATRIEDLLGQWESYAAALNGGNDLRSVYDLLQDMTGDLKDLKASMPGFLESNDALGSLVNELDVLATTENIKFNRGDYL